MATRLGGKSLPDTYLALVREFPLIHISDVDHLDEARRMIDELLRRRLDRGSEAYLDALTDLVQVFEDQHVPIPDSPPEDVLRELMTASGLSQPALAKAVSIAQSTLSSVLRGHRKLTTDHIARLARYFHISPAAFFPTRDSAR